MVDNFDATFDCHVVVFVVFAIDNEDWNLGFLPVGNRVKGAVLLPPNRSPPFGDVCSELSYDTAAEFVKNLLVGGDGCDFLSDPSYPLVPGALLKRRLPDGYPDYGAHSFSRIWGNLAIPFSQRSGDFR